MLPSLLSLLLACVHAPPSTADTPTAAPPSPPTAGAAVAAISTPSDPVVDRILAAARADAHAWNRLASLCDEVGARPAGSAELERAVEWSLARFREDGLANVHAEPVTVNVWVRGDESLTMLAPRKAPLAMLGLGGSVGTPGVEASVVVVRSFDELGPQVAGKIVLFDSPMEEGLPTIERYGTAVQYRTQGAARAAEFGAVATLVRSVTTRSLYTPHTGAMSYVEGGRRIPAAAITPEDADQIARLTAAGTDVRVRLVMGAGERPPAVSHNVIAEIPGETPEIVLLGAHLDSWDVGQGAQDDGAGVIHVIEAMRALRSLGVTPKRTIRAVLFTNEEHGLEGGKTYAQVHGAEPHAAAIESDLGAGRILGWEAVGSMEQLQWFDAAAGPVGLLRIGDGGGADISPLEDRGVLLVGLHPDDSRYFDIHHTRADTVDKVDPAALADGVGRMAALAWRLANAE